MTLYEYLTNTTTTSWGKGFIVYALVVISVITLVFLIGQFQEMRRDYKTVREIETTAKKMRKDLEKYSQKK